MTPQLPTSAAQAKREGSTRYQTGKPCIRGHTGPRFTAGAECIECRMSLMKTDAFKAHHSNWFKKYRERNVERQKTSMLKAKYGISSADVERMFSEQEGKCSICKAPMLPNGTKSAKAAVVDHCHDSGKVRSLLCGHCNRGLGMFYDNPQTLEAAAEYVRAHVWD